MTDESSVSSDECSFNGSIKYDFMIIDDKDNLYLDINDDGRLILPTVLVPNMDHYIIFVKNEMKKFANKKKEYYVMTTSESGVLGFAIVNVKSKILSNKCNTHRYVKVHISKLRHLFGIYNLFTEWKTRAIRI